MLTRAAAVALAFVALGQLEARAAERLPRLTLLAPPTTLHLGAGGGSDGVAVRPGTILLQSVGSLAIGLGLPLLVGEGLCLVRSCGSTGDIGFALGAALFTPFLSSWFVSWLAREAGLSPHYWHVFLASWCVRLATVGVAIFISSLGIGADDIAIRLLVVGLILPTAAEVIVADLSGTEPPVARSVDRQSAADAALASSRDARPRGVSVTAFAARF